MVKNKERQKKSINNFIKYSAIGFQMAAAVGVSTWIGVALDDHYQKDNLFTIIFSLLGVCSGIYLGIKDFIKTND